MFQINRKEYTHLIDALGELQTALETERETQQLMADGSEDSFKGAAGMAMRAGLTVFLNQGVYEEAYQQSKKMKESMESLLPLVNKLSRDADTLEQYLEVDVVVNPHMPLGVLYVPPGSDIFMLDESYANYVEQNCEDLVRRGNLLKTQMQAAIDECAGIIDCSKEQLAINEALKSVLRIEKFQEAFQSYVAGVKMLDESLRMDFLSLVDAEDIECGKALQNVIYNEELSNQIIDEVDVLNGTEAQLGEESYYINKYVNEETLCKINPRWEENMDTFKEVYGEDVFVELRKYMYQYGITDEVSILMFLSTIGIESKYGVSVVQGQDGNPAYGMEDMKVIPNVNCELGVGLLQVTGIANQQNFIKYKYLELDKESEEKQIFEDIFGEITKKSNLDPEKTAGFICKYYPIESAMWYWTEYDDRGQAINDFVVEHKEGNLFNVFYATQGITNGTEFALHALKRIAGSETNYIIVHSSEYETGFSLYYEDEIVELESYGPYHWDKRLEDWQNAQMILRGEK